MGKDEGKKVCNTFFGNECPNLSMGKGEGKKVCNGVFQRTYVVQVK
jgi:hypothetical protein